MSSTWQRTGDVTPSTPNEHPSDTHPVRWVALAGFMGTGKSRIGWELSRRLQLTFIDTDRVIERVSCLKIPEIFELYGEETFRAYETEVVRRTLRLDDVVVSTGGGTVVRAENRRLLRARGPVVVLDASPETIYKRTRRHKRPMLEVGDPTERIRSLMRERAPAYDEVASFHVSGDDRVSTDVVDDIIEGLWSWAERHPDLAAQGPIDLREAPVPGEDPIARLDEAADAAFEESDAPEDA